jgi:hypothetical protein
MIEAKSEEIQELYERNVKLEEILNQIKYNEDKFKDYEKRISMLGTEIQSTKTIYDGFLKNKQKPQNIKK